MLQNQEYIKVEDEAKRVRAQKSRNEIKGAHLSKIFQIRRIKKEVMQQQIRRVNRVLELNTSEEARRAELERVEIEMLFKLKNSIAEQQRAVEELNRVKRPLPGEEVRQKIIVEFNPDAHYHTQQNSRRKKIAFIHPRNSIIHEIYGSAY